MAAMLIGVIQATVKVISHGLPELPAGWTANYATWLLPKIA
jgi:hypothetical protein